jgi:DNA-3-methyladenine glycosylase II
MQAGATAASATVTGVSLTRLDGPVLAEAIDRLAAIDPDVAAAVARIGYPIPRLREPGFATLLRIMVAQQVSTRAAAAIWSRLELACAPLVSAERFLALDEDALRLIGLSRRKMEYGRGLAEAVASQALDLEGLAEHPEEAAIAAISALRGFGRWSAEIYLLFALGRTDSFPGDDLAVQIGMQRLKGLPARPDRKAMDVLAEPWRPYRGCGALLLWHVYGSATLDDRR